YRYAEGLRQPGASGAGGAEARSAEWPFVLLPGPARRSVEGDLACRPGRLPVHQASGTRPVPVAERGRRRGDNLTGATGLSVVRDRLAPSAGELASDLDGMRILLAAVDGYDSIGLCTTHLNRSPPILLARMQ